MRHRYHFWSRTVLLAASLTLLPLSVAAMERDVWEQGIEDWHVSVSRSEETPTSVARPDPVCAGDNAMHFGVTFQDNGRGFRSELTPRESASAWRLQFDQEYWLAWSVYLPPGHVPDSTSDTLFQIHGSPDADEPWRRPPLAIKTEPDGHWKVVIRRSSSATSTGLEPEFSRHVTLNNYSEDLGRWSRFVMRLRLSHTDAGILELWKNDELVLRHNGPTTYNDDRPPYLKFGIYKPGWKAGNPSRVSYREIFLDDVSIARSRSFLGEHCGTEIAPIPMPPTIAGN